MQNPNAKVELVPPEPMASADLRGAVDDFLFREAECLDDRRLSEWIGLLTHDIEYKIPVRSSIYGAQPAAEFSERAFHMIEDYGTLVTRMKRFDTGDAWSESPPSRMRRHVSNIRVRGANHDQVEVRSNLLLFWSRQDDQKLVSAERHDVLRLVKQSIRLARRTVFLDHTTLPLPNFSLVL